MDIFEQINKSVGQNNSVGRKLLMKFNKSVGGNNSVGGELVFKNK